MINSDPDRIGRVTDVSAHHLTVTLDIDPEQTSTSRDNTSTTHSGAHLMVRSRGAQLLARVVRSWSEEGLTRLELMPLGNITSDGSFSRGVSQFPSLGAGVYAVGTNQLAALFDTFRRFGVHLGRHSQHPELKVYFDPNPLFGRHLAILGQSGAGKSWTVASILQRTAEALPKAHIVLLDIHGEYGWHDADGKLHSAFPEHMARHVDARALEIPYWLLTYAELIDLLIDRSDPNASLQMAFMREVLFNLRKKANRDLGIDSLSVDSPVFFSIK